ncbi:vWA domain-containing protein [Litoribacter populi]|uniref:vWA domain-containing protein n=1 Tax=Litoribacter populi TaxID=2598460 RepID=UPI00117C3E6D|nr:VWA domain-containing protein [Litoribacter populi]
MIWAYPDFNTISILAVFFTLLYVIYLYRFYRINTKLKVQKGTLLVKLLIRTAYFILFLVAFTGPSIGGALKEIKEEGKDIFIAVDLSRSMDAQDIAPSRLERIKMEMKKLVKNFDSDRIGIIIFSSEAFIQCPLTFDQNIIQLHIDGLNTGLVPNYGTDLAAPLELALTKFNQDANPGNTSKSIILISDGEDFGENLENAIKNLNESGVRVFSLGVGTAEGSTIPQGSGVIMDRRQGRPAITKLESTTLKTVSTRTDGQYFELSDTAMDIPYLISAIERIEGTVTGTRMVEASANKYFFFLLAGLGLALLDMILPLRTISM